MPGHKLFCRLLKLCGLPLAAPSANPFGYISPTSAAHVRASLGTKIRYILEGGDCEIGLESTIVDLRDPKAPRILRPGAITREQVAQVLRRPVLLGAPKASELVPQVAPGMLKRHYSPNTPVTLHERLAAKTWQKSRANEAWLLLAKPRGKVPANIFWLDDSGKLSGVARTLFGKLRELDRAGFQRIHAELASGGGLADAINDRLRRAAAKRAH
jgi:L-threonylcarbamoyladenylate synthase